MPRYLRIVALSLFLWGLIVVFFLPGISTRLSRISRFGEADTEKVAQREVARPAAAPAAAQKTNAKLFWAAADGESLEAVEVELPLSESAEERAHQLLDALITLPPSEARRTLPAAALGVGQSGVVVLAATASPVWMPEPMTSCPSRSR